MPQFGEMVADHIPNLRRYARVLVRDSIHAEDLVQDCLERAISREHLWREGTNLRAWLFTILHNLYINQYLRHGSVNTMVPLLDEHTHLSCPARQVHSVTLKDLARAFDHLPEQEQQVVLMVGLDGMQYEDAAAALGVPMGTVKSRLSRARRRLRRLLDGDQAMDDSGLDHNGDDDSPRPLADPGTPHRLTAHWPNADGRRHGSGGA
ncbi:MAG: sigma-70 family RNA polymerase sigma factor [Bacteroidota bacterium]